MSESSDSKVEILLPVHFNGYDELMELFFVIGVLGDFAGKPEDPRPLKLRKFVTIDLENFDDVLRAYSPRLLYSVENKLHDGGPEFEVELNFKCLADFDRDNVKKQFAPLSQFLENAKSNPEINEKRAAQLSSIMQHQAFKDLEAAWRGLYYLVKNVSPRIKVRIIHAAKKELLKDFGRNEEISASVLYKCIYKDEFNVFAGQPYSILIGNYEFANHPEDIALLQSISKVAAAAQAPFITGVSPRFLFCEHFLELYDRRNPAKAFVIHPENNRWHEFRETEEASYVSLCLPHFLLRKADGDEDTTAPILSEETDRISKHLWGNAAFAFGVVVARAFARNKWPAQIDGEEFGILEDVPSVRVWDDISPIDAVVIDYYFRDLINENFNIITKYDNDCYFFLSANSCKRFKPLRDLSEANPPVDTDLHISALIPVTLIRARFMQYLIKLIRHKSLRRHTAKEWQEILNNWIASYCANSWQECSPARPLAEARIEVENAIVDGEPSFTARINIIPGYQLPEIESLNEIVFSDF